MLNLDTHILLNAWRGDLRPRERELLATHGWGVASIVLWEIAKLSQIGRIEVDLADPAVVNAVAQLHVWPLDLAITRTSTRLDIHGDPADELIAATSVVHGVRLLTRDRAIRRSKVVPLA